MDAVTDTHNAALFRVLLSLHYTNGEWSGVHHLPCFYVHAVTGEHAREMALAVANPDTRFTTSGSAIAVDGSLDPISATYFTWSTP